MILGRRQLGSLDSSRKVVTSHPSRGHASNLNIVRFNQRVRTRRIKKNSKASCMQNTRWCYALKKRASLRLVDVVTLAGLVKVVEEHQNDKARDLPASIRRFPRNSTSCNPARVISTRSRKMFACFSPRLFGRKYSSPFPLSTYAYSMFQKVGTNLQEHVIFIEISEKFWVNVGLNIVSFHLRITRTALTIT